MSVVPEPDKMQPSATNGDVVIKQWQDLSVEEKKAVKDLEISEQQIEYAGPTARIVAMCDSDTSGHVVGAAIFHEDVVVGFLAMKRCALNPNWATPGDAVVSGLRIDSRWQGRGIGTAALRHLPDWTLNCWPTTTRIMLSVDEQNEQAIRSYAKAGWHETGSREQGRIGWVRYMALELRQA